MELGTLKSIPFEEMVTHLDPLSWDDKFTLRSLSLTSRSLRFISQKRLFSAISLLPLTPANRGRIISFRKLYALLVRSPHLGAYVRYFAYFASKADIAVTPCAEALSTLSNVEELRISQCTWEELPHEWSTGLARLMQGRHVRRIELSGVSNLPYVVLKSLSRTVSFIELNSVGIKRDDGDHAVDPCLPRMRYLRMFWYGAASDHHLQAALQLTPSLEELKLIVNVACKVDGIAACIISVPHILSSLDRLTIHIVTLFKKAKRVEDMHIRRLEQELLEFSSISTSNPALSTLRLALDWCNYDIIFREAMGRLDRVLAYHFLPKFSHLREVEIALSLPTKDPIEGPSLPSPIGMQTAQGNSEDLSLSVLQEVIESEFLTFFPSLRSSSVHFRCSVKLRNGSDR